MPPPWPSGRSPSPSTKPGPGTEEARNRRPRPAALGRAPPGRPCHGATPAVTDGPRANPDSAGPRNRVPATATDHHRGTPPKGQPGNLVGLQVGQTLGDAFPHGDGMASEEAGVGTRNSVRWLTIRNNLPIKYKFFLFSDLSFIPGSVLPVPIRRRSDREPMV